MSRLLHVALLGTGLLFGSTAPLSAQFAQGKEVTALLFAPDGKTLYIAGADGALRFWDVEQTKERFCTQAHGGIFGLALSPDSRTLATSGKDGAVRLWEAARAAEIRTLKGHGGTVAAVAFSPDGKRLASAGYDRTVRLWETANGEARAVLRAHGDKVTSVAFAHDGKTLASAGVVSAGLAGLPDLAQGDQVLLWDLTTGQPPRRIGLRGDRLGFSPGGRFLTATGMVIETTVTPKETSIAGGPRTVVWDLRRNREHFRLTDHWVALALSADGRFLASGWGKPLHIGTYVSGKDQCVGVHIWEISTGQEVWRCQLPKEHATALAFAPDGKRLAVGAADGSFRMHELKPEGWRPPNKLAAEELHRAWEHLTGKAALAYEALWTLTAAGEEAVAFLKGRLKPLAPDRHTVARLLADLDSPHFKARQKAFRDLATLADQIEPELEQALKDMKTSLEARRRLGELLAQASAAPAPERLREDRALAVLERIATPPALAALKTLAEGAPRTRMAEQAQEALKRLDARRTNK
jgi:WD40 repeat protein